MLLLSYLFVFVGGISLKQENRTLFFVVGLWNSRAGTKILRQLFSVKPVLCAVTNVVSFFPKTVPAKGPRYSLLLGHSPQ